MASKQDLAGAAGGAGDSGRAGRDHGEVDGLLAFEETFLLGGKAFHGDSIDGQACGRQGKEAVGVLVDFTRACG